MWIKGKFGWERIDYIKTTTQPTAQMAKLQEIERFYVRREENNETLRIDMGRKHVFYIDRVQFNRPLGTITFYTEATSKPL